MPDERHNLLLPQLERWPLDPARPVIVPKWAGLDASICSLR